MLTTNTKKVVVGVLALAMIFSFSFASADTMTTTSTNNTTTTTTVAPYVFTTNLTVGSRGASVVALQTMLVARGFLVMPAGVAMGYFGSLTRSALAAFQASVGISPAVGYFGPITRAYIASHPELFGAASTTTTTTTGTTCPANTTCTSNNTGTTCPAGYTCTPVGGTTSGTSNGQGTLTVTQGPPGSNSNIQNNVDVPVYGLQLRAQLGDVRVDRIDLDVADVISGSNQIENPGNFINSIKIWDGSTVVLSRNVTSADFVQGTSSTDYYIRLAGINFTVPSGSTKNMQVTFSTAGSIDSNRTLTIRGYGASSLQYFTGSNNIVNYSDISNIMTVQTFQKPGNTTVIVSVDQSNPLSMTNYVDINNGSQNVPLVVFSTNTTQGTSKVTQVTATIRTGLSSGTFTAGGNAAPNGGTTTFSGATVFPTGAHLFQGSQELQYQPVNSASTTITFNNLNLASTNGGNVYSIKVDMPASTANGTVASGTVNSVTYQNSNGNQQTSTSTVTGNNQYFFHATPQLTLVGSPSVAVVTNGATNAVQVTPKFTFTMTPYPGTAAVPSANDFTIIARNSAAATSSVITSKGLVISPQPTSGIMAANQTYTITLTGNDVGTSPGTQTVVYYVTAASSTVKDAQGTDVNIIQTWGFDNWHTDPVSK